MRPHKLFCLSILFCFLNLMTLVARATDAKICLWQIKHRRVQTAAVVLCRGVYVFIGRVVPIIRLEMCHIIHAEMLSRLFTGFSAGCFSLSRPLCSVNLSWTNSARSESPDWAVEFWNFRFLLVKPLRAAPSPT